LETRCNRFCNSIPQVKTGDEWGDPANCDAGDACQYCHTRTEQQFHPEIYKSTKCNDIQNTSYCPRGAFCAFAHVERKITSFFHSLPEKSSSQSYQIKLYPKKSALKTANLRKKLPIFSLF
jgi:hypothetical protein